MEDNGFRAMETYVRPCTDPMAPNATFLLNSPMAGTGTTRAIAGGLCGPIAGAFYLAAGVGLFLKPAYGRVGQLACAGHVIMMVVVSAYHSAYPYTAFLASAQTACVAATAEQHMTCSILEAVLMDHVAYMKTMKFIIKVGGVASTVGLMAICGGYRVTTQGCTKSSESVALPGWMVLFSPGLWLIGLRESGILRSLPAPLGVVLAGGSFNIAFALFFTVVTLFASSTAVEAKSKHE